MEHLETKSAAPEAAEGGLVLKLSKPYVFEGQTCAEVDLGGLETVTAGMLERVGRTVLQQSPALNPAMLESTTPFCIEMAVRVTGKPYEFFRGLPARDGMRLKALVSGFFYGADGAE